MQSGAGMTMISGAWLISVSGSAPSSGRPTSGRSTSPAPHPPCRSRRRCSRPSSPRSRPLEEIEDAMRLAGGAPTAVVPTAPGAADYIVRSLAPNFLGGRIPERLAGEVWCVGWCGRPCPGFEGPCHGGGGRCLRPVLIRRGGTVALEAHSNHLCDRCRRFRNTRDNRF